MHADRSLYTGRVAETALFPLQKTNQSTPIPTVPDSIQFNPQTSINNDVYCSVVRKGILHVAVVAPRLPHTVLNTWHKATGEVLES